MKTVAAVFTSIAGAQRAVNRLKTIGIAESNINFLTPGASETQVNAVPTTEGEQPGMGKAVGAVVGAASGAALGPLAASAITALIPGIGPVAASGILATTLLGIGGAVAGATAGGALENALDEGLPRDELFIYKDALRQGRTVLIVLVEDDEQAAAVRKVFTAEKAETIDAAREQWWVGLRDVEEEEYRAHGGDFRKDEADYRRGFEEAQRMETRGKTYQTALKDLRERNPEIYKTEAFRRGFERGQEYRRQMTNDD